MTNILSDFQHVFPAPCIFFSILCAGLCVPGQSSFESIFIVYTERRVGVSCSVYDMLHTDAKGYIIMCKLVKLAFCLCYEPIDPSNIGFAVGTRQLILQHPLKLLNTMYKHVPSNIRLGGLPQKRLNKYMQLPALLRYT